MSSRVLLLALVLSVSTTSARAQCAGPPQPAVLPLFVNDEAELYVRVRQDVGDAPQYPWSVRGFGAPEACRLASASADSPWRSVLTGAVRVVGPVRIVALPVSLNAIANSSFPYGMNDGALWAGRGVTSSLTGGFVMAAGPVSLVVAPMAFRAENSRFSMASNGLSGAYAFGDPFSPSIIDQPQRFGTRPYERLSPGNSTLRVDAGGVAFGISTANQQWGPARDNPLVLGNNAEGYPNVFVGTSHPIDVGIARVHARIHWGRLDSSPYTPARLQERYRFATGLVATIEPKGMDGLELGFGRYFHLRWSDSVLTVANFTRPFIGLVRNNRIAASGNALGDEPDNQIASIFARWVFPRSGIEVYGEAGKDDYNSDFRDLLMEPDHISAYLLGFQRVVRRGGGAYLVIRGELFNARANSLQLNRHEGQLYLHGPAVPEGHTNLGQVLGAAAGNGGGGAGLAVDHYDKSGRLTVAWTRTMRQEYREPGTQVPIGSRADVLEALTLSGLRFLGRTAITYEATGVYELNRYFRGDAGNARVALGVMRAW